MSLLCSLHTACCTFSYQCADCAALVSAFYKFRTSPVFTKSARTSPSSKNAALSPSPLGQQPTLSPVLSDSSLIDEPVGGMDGMHSDLEGTTNPPSPTEDISQLHAGRTSMPSMEALNRRFEARQKVSAATYGGRGARLAEEPENEQESVNGREGVSAPFDKMHRDNSLGLGFEVEGVAVHPLDTPDPELMHVRTPSSNSVDSASMVASPGSSDSRKSLDEDFDEAKQAIVNAQDYAQAA